MINKNNNKAWLQHVFDRAASCYGEKGCQYFDEFGRQLVALAQLKPGEKILDVATGKGAILFPASQAVGESGVAIGIDLSPKMIEATQKYLLQSSARCSVMDAEQLSFSDDFFDVVFCGFALFFFPHLTTVLDEWKRVLKSGGRVAVSTWGKPCHLTEWIVSRANFFGATKQLKAQDIDAADVLKQILAKAGFRSITIIEKKQVFWHSSPEEWWESLWSHATRARLEQLSSADLELLRREALEHARKCSLNGRIAETLHVIFGMAEC